MELLRSLLSQAIRFQIAGDHAPVFLPDLCSVTSERFKFVERPGRASEYNLEQGVTFEMGTYDGVQIDRFKIYRNGLVAEGMTTTRALDAFLDELETMWLKEYGIQLIPTVPYPRLYSSRVEVQSDIRLEKALAPILTLADIFERRFSRYGIVAPSPSVNGFSLLADPTEVPAGPKPTRFIIERRQERPFTEGVYFSEAPLQTHEHLDMLLDLEGLIK